MNARNLVIALMLATIGVCVADVARADGADLIFIDQPGGELAYSCSINLLREWPASVSMDNGLLANSCSAPIVVNRLSPLRSKFAPPLINVSDRPWTVTLMSDDPQDIVYHDCILVSHALEQGSATVVLACAGAQP